MQDLRHRRALLLDEVVHNICNFELLSFSRSLFVEVHPSLIRCVPQLSGFQVRLVVGSSGELDQRVELLLEELVNFTISPSFLSLEGVEGLQPMLSFQNV